MQSRRSQSTFDVIVLGAGAAGLMCALTAAQRGRKVLVLEKSNKAGKKILMSGGGRCNFTNLYVEPENYLSQNLHFCKPALLAFTQWDFIALVARYGIAYEERSHGQLFCEQTARDILALLINECDQAGVEIRTDCDPVQVEPFAGGGGIGETSSRFMVGIKGHAQDCESVVVATGALSIPTLGGSGMGYEIAEQFGLAVTGRRAGLVPFMFSDALKPLCERLTGTSLLVEACCNNQSFTEQLLFTHRGMSGPVILQISSYWHPGDEVLIDLLPDFDLASWLFLMKKQQGVSLLRTLLSQKLPRSLVLELQSLWWAVEAEKPVAEIADGSLVKIAEHIHRWRLKPSATEGYRTAEVTLGGVDTDGLNSRTMEARRHPGLYFVGEVVDVSGHLGGFNFQWAWSSGFVAGSVA